MHSLKYVEFLILFYSNTVHVGQVWLSNVLCAPPPVPVTILITFISALPRPLPHTRSRRGTRGSEKSGHVSMVRLGILAVSPPPLFSSGFLL